MSAFPAIALAIALTYVIGDIYKAFLPFWLSLLVDTVVCYIIYRVVNHYLKQLRD